MNHNVNKLRIRANSLIKEGDALENQGNYSAAELVYQQALEMQGLIFDEYYEGSILQMAECLIKLAELAVIQEDYEKARLHIEKGCAYLDCMASITHLPSLHRKAAVAYVLWGDVADTPEDAISAYEDALDHLEMPFGGHLPCFLHDKVELFGKLAFMKSWVGDMDGYHRHFNDLLHLRSRL